jgi:diguanylate cyclase (GGDEF)-like protein
MWVVCLLLSATLLPIGYGERGVGKEVKGLRTLTTAAAVHELGMVEAKRGYPVLLRAVVTYYDPYLDAPQPVLLVTDATGTVFVRLPLRSSLPVKDGELVEIQGVTVPGGFAPDVANPTVRILGDGRYPPDAPLRSLTYLRSGREDAPWVEMEGVVHSVKESEHNVTLKIAGGDGMFTAVTVRKVGVDYAHLFDARVRIRGVACSLFNARKQIVGIQMRFADLDAVQVEDASSRGWFELPVSSIDLLGSFQPGQRVDRLVHIRGVVTLWWPGRMLCIQDTKDGLCAMTEQTAALHPGDLVEVVGFSEARDYTPVLVDARFQLVPGDRHPSATAMEASQALAGKSDAQLVEIEGQVIGLDRGGEDPTVLLASGDLIFSASLPRSSGGEEVFRLAEGSLLRVRGVCRVEADPEGKTDADGYQMARSFQVLMRSPEDIAILRRPSWWNARHALAVLACALVAISGVLVWVLVLRRRLERQAKQLQFQATHDSLTGLWNRRAVLDLLRREHQMAVRSRIRIGIMMLDADHFKAVNDTHGHLAGDAVLQEIAKRIRQSIRPSELASRFGGEEFLIVVPGCDEVRVMMIAERIRAAVSAKPIACGGMELTVTVSLGVSILEPAEVSEERAVAAADQALYEAKRAGRNCVVLSAPAVAAAEEPATQG